MRKLTDSDKQEILKLYRETAETTSTLAERYDVSNSTISRLLKSTLPE
ncbi:helix-turn-helix domain-containing protein, partial [Nostocaceae cyanobacterium CENA357]